MLNYHIDPEKQAMKPTQNSQPTFIKKENAMLAQWMNYIQDIDEPFACKLEAILSSFGRQTCLLEFQNLTPTFLTDYFTPK